MTDKKHLLIIAGEISSDNHGYKLIKELKKQGQVEITAVGGSKMASVADNFEENIVGKAVVGFVEVIKVIPYFIGLKNKLVKKFFQKSSEKPIDGLVLIDYPGFNVRLAKIACKYNVPVFYYITPQVWAWGSSRIGLLSEICRKMYCVFEFEKKIFEEAGGSVEFVGHPLLEDIPGEIDIEKFNMNNNLSEDEKVIAVLPGSRISEVEKHLPIIAGALADIKARIIIGRASSVPEKLIYDFMDEPGLTGNVYTLLKRAEIAVVSSGTSTLEATVIGVPFITVYKVSKLSYSIANLLGNREFIRKGCISMVNILAGKQVVPELVQKEFTVDNLKEEINGLLNSPDKITLMKEELKKIRNKIGSQGASERTAGSILKELAEE
ncbi:lipid-A-disaccharide synthase [Elusimicrobiota bacterium]